MSREGDIKARHMDRVMRQPIFDRQRNEMRLPTVSEAEAQIARVVQRSEAEKREGRKPTQAEAATPESLAALQAEGGYMLGEEHERLTEDEIRTRAGGSYADRYALIDWSK